MHKIEDIIKNINNQKGQPYPCSNQNVTNIIFAYKKDNKINNFIDKNNGQYISKNQVVFPNKEKWLIVSMGTASKAYRAYKTYIDNRIPIKDFYEVVLPIISGYCCFAEVF